MVATEHSGDPSDEDKLLSELVTFLEGQDISLGSLRGWHASVTFRTTGSRQKKMDVSYQAPDGSRFRSRAEVARYLVAHKTSMATDAEKQRSRARAGRKRPFVEQSVSRRVGRVDRRGASEGCGGGEAVQHSSKVDDDDVNEPAQDGHNVDALLPRGNCSGEKHVSEGQSSGAEGAGTEGQGLLASLHEQGQENTVNTADLQRSCSAGIESRRRVAWLRAQACVLP